MKDKHYAHHRRIAHASPSRRARRRASVPLRPFGADLPDLINDEVQQLIQLVQENNITELLVEQGRAKIHIRRQSQGTGEHQAGQECETANLGLSGEDAGKADGTLVFSPMVGRFYRSSSPQAPPFVDVGQLVAQGQKLCIIEAMKVMNEVHAEVEGEVVEILAESGQAVEYGQPLFRLKINGNGRDPLVANDETGE